MANLPESSTYDVGVYQIETTDAVQGGVSGVDNAPLKNLANRTNYLKTHLDLLESGATIPSTIAPLNSPTFTGDPKAPTAAAGDNDTSLATTAFAKRLVAGVLTKSVAGGANITLTDDEAGNGILVLTGAITANIALIVPNTQTRAWTIKNSTTGSFTVTVKTASGTGVVVTQGTSAVCWTDMTNVYDSLTDFDSVALTGAPTAPTPTGGDNSTKVSTTAFVQGELAAKAPINSPTFTGDPKAPTPSPGDNDTSIATTAFVQTAATAAAAALNARIRLTTDLTIYVNASTGNDSNSGLAIGSAFLTVQAAINLAVTRYDLAGYQITIQLADGTYAVSGGGSVGSISAPVEGAVSDDRLVINGNAVTPSNVICQSTGGQGFAAVYGAGFKVQNLKIQIFTGGNALLAQFGGRILFSNIVFGAVPSGNYHLYSIWAGSSVIAQGNYTVSGGGNCHAYAAQGATISVNGYTVTLTGTPAFTTSFVYAVYAGVTDFSSVTFSGAATGARYQAFVNGVVNSNGGGASYFPGNSAGSTASGGQYA